MIRYERICRMLRDIGIFMFGIASLCASLQYCFVHLRAEREMQQAMERFLRRDVGDSRENKEESRGAERPTPPQTKTPSLPR